MSPRAFYRDEKNMPVYAGALYQNGSGLSTTLSKYIIPLWNKVSPFIKKNVSKAAKRMAQNVLEGHDIKSAIKKTAYATGRDILSDLGGSGVAARSHARDGCRGNRAAIGSKQKHQQKPPIVTDVFGVV